MSIAPPDTDPLARNCQRLLRAYPRWWRAGQRGDELYWVLYETADADHRTRPSPADTANILAHGLATRLRAADIAVPDAVRRHIAHLSLAVAVGLSLFLTAGGELRIRGWSDGTSPGYLDEWLRPTWGPFQTFGILIYGLWAVAVAHYLRGHNRLSREFAIAAGCLSLAMPALADIAHRQRPPGGALVTLAVLAAGVAALPTNRPSTRGERYTVAGLGAATLSGLIAWRLYWLTQATRGGPPVPSSRSNRTARTMFYWAPNEDGRSINRALAHGTTWVVVALIIAALAVWYRDRTWLPAAVYLLAPATTLRLGTTEFDIHPAVHPEYRVLETIGIAIAVIALHGLLIARLLRLPWRRTTRRQADAMNRDRPEHDEPKPSAGIRS